MTTLGELVTALVRRPGETWRLDPPGGKVTRFQKIVPVHCPRCFEYKDPDGNPNPKYNSVNLVLALRGKYLVWVGRCLPCGLIIYMMQLRNLRGAP